jgi:hypothetical protein
MHAKADRAGAGHRWEPARGPRAHRGRSGADPSDLCDKTLTGGYAVTDAHAPRQRQDRDWPAATGDGVHVAGSAAQVACSDWGRDPRFPSGWWIIPGLLIGPGFWSWIGSLMA